MFPYHCIHLYFLFRESFPFLSGMWWVPGSLSRIPRAFPFPAEGPGPQLLCDGRGELLCVFLLSRNWGAVGSGRASWVGHPQGEGQRTGSKNEARRDPFFSSSQVCLFKSQLPGPPGSLHPAQPAGREGLSLTAARLSLSCFMWEEIREKEIMKTMCSNSLTVG